MYSEPTAASMAQVRLADAQLRAGRMGEASASIELARELLGDAGESCAPLWCVQGRLSLRQGRHGEAHEALDRAVSLYQSQDDEDGAANSRLALAELYRIENRRVLAEKELEVAWEMALRGTDLGLQAAVLAGLGALELQFLALPQAEELYEEAWGRARRAGDWELVAKSLLGLGEVHSRQGRVRAVETLLEGARMLARRGQHHGLAGALLRVSDHGLRYGHFELALVASLSASLLWAEGDSVRGVGLALRVVVKALAAQRLAEPLLMAAVLRDELAGDHLPHARAVARFYKERSPAALVERLESLGTKGLQDALWQHLAERLAPRLMELGAVPGDLATPSGALEVVTALVLGLEEDDLPTEDGSHDERLRASSMR